MRLRSIDRAVLGALLPSGASPLLRQGLLDTGFEAFLVDFDAAAPTDFCRIFRLALVAAGWVAPLLIGHAPPMSRLNSGDRESAGGNERVTPSRVASARDCLEDRRQPPLRRAA